MLIIDQYVSLNIQQAIGVDQMTVYIFSYFYDIANDAGLLLNEDDASTITTIPIRVLKQTAKNICRGRSDASTKHPFLCLIHGLLV